VNLSKEEFKEVRLDDDETNYFIFLKKQPKKDELLYKKFSLNLFSFMELNYDKFIDTRPVETELVSINKDYSDDYIYLELKSSDYFSIEEQNFFLEGFLIDKNNIEIEKINNKSLKDIKVGYYRNNGEIEYLDPKLIKRNYKKNLIILDFSNLEIINNRNFNDLKNKEFHFFDKEGNEINEIILIEESVSKLISEDSQEILLEKIDENTYLPNNLPNENKIYIGDDGIKYKCIIIKERPKNSVTIKLIEDEEEETDELAQKTSIDYFFDEDVEFVLGHPEYTISKNRDQIFKIIYRDRERQILELLLSSEPRKTSRRLNHISKNRRKIYAYKSTYQMEIQKTFLNILLKRPISYYLPLLMLGVDKNKSKDYWKEFEQNKIEKWYVLTDEEYESTQKQREFVKIALDTPDFAFLEGPPGSGKTTAILELILQYIMRGKKVLLAASTHVAIDNILELLIEKYDEYLDKIFPIRIGKNWNISELVRNFQIENILSDKYDKFRPENLTDLDKLILDSSNLICGTTIGILQYPLFKLVKNNKMTAYPMFDVLIIDESSKTTFQEFIVPALFAKKWILVGDIKQLAPYTESLNVSRYLDNYVNSNNQIIDENLKLALFYKFIIFSTIREFNKVKNASFCIPTKKEVIEYLKREIIEFKKYIKEENENYQENLYDWPVIIFIEEKINNHSSEFISISKKSILSHSPITLTLHAGKYLFIESSLLEEKEIIDNIPSNYIIVGLKDENKTLMQFYRYFNLFFKEELNKEGFLKREYNYLKDINKFITEKSWASELSWRLVRVFELRDVENAQKRYIDAIEILIPRIYDLKYAIDDVYHSVFPSILEVLQVGLSGKNILKINNSPLRVGLEKSIFEKRHVFLEYQMRMHPKISKFSREIFYDNEKLKDSCKINREWNYKVMGAKDYSDRFVWFNIVYNSRRKTRNIKEARAIMSELKRFILWASINGKKIKDDWSVAVITYYNSQRRLLMKKLQKFTKQNYTTTFRKNNVSIYINTVDKIQGREADLVLLSMVRNRNRRGKRNFSILGFMDNPNRLNVALTRAKYQLVIYGDIENFADPSASYFTAELTKYVNILNENANNIIRREENFEGYKNMKRKSYSSLATPDFYKKRNIHNGKLIKTCKICNKKFKARNPSHKYCDKCFRSKRKTGYR